MEPIGLNEAIAMIRDAESVMIWCPITHGEGHHIPVSKTQAIRSLREFEPLRNGSPIRIRSHGGIVAIG